MAGNLTAMIASIFSGSAVSTDPYFNYTTLLLSTTATNGQQNNTFQDSSTNNFTITRNPATGPNAPTQGTFSPFSQTGWGNYFDGSGDYLTAPNNAAFGFGASDFTIEAWIFPTAFSGFNSVFCVNVSGGLFFGALNGTTSFGLRAAAVSDILTATSPSLNTWTHVAVTRSGVNVYLFYNGVQQATTTSSYSFAQSSIGIGSDGGNSSLFTGYISNLRVIKGQALYTSAFTPSTTSLTTTSQGATAGNVSLLTCQSNRFIDTSTNNFTITRNGDSRVVAFSPFNPTASWSAATNGGSGYFDGSGDYLSVSSATAAGSGSFCFESWIYLTNSTSNQMILGNATSGGMWVGINIDSANKLGIGRVATAIDNQVSFTWVPYQWYHVVVNRNGTVLQFFVNGTQVGATASNSINYSIAGRTVGAEGTGSAPFFGYMSSWRFVNSSVYTSDFTPPTAPLTAITNTSLLLNFTNAGIYDATSKNDLETVGNAQVSNTTSQWPSTSMLFNGTTDYLQVNTASDLYNLSSGDWTIEAWVYRTSTANNKSGIITYLDNQSVSISGWAFDCGVTFAGQLGFYSYNSGSGTTTITSSSGAVPINTWTYVAARCVGTAITLYINGASVASGTRGTIANNANCRLRIGSWNYPTAPRYWQGYIQDPRITKGYARTIATPTAAFPVQ